MLAGCVYSKPCVPLLCLAAATCKHCPWLGLLLLPHRQQNICGTRWAVFAEILSSVAGKGIKGFVARPGQQARSVSPTKRKQKALVKVTVGNKKMMAQGGISVSQTVDDYMREMEVTFLHTSKLASLAAQAAKYTTQKCCTMRQSCVPTCCTRLYVALPFSTIRSIPLGVPQPAQQYCAMCSAQYKRRKQVFSLHFSAVWRGRLTEQPKTKLCFLALQKDCVCLSHLYDTCHTCMTAETN